MSECISHHKAMSGATGRYVSRSLYVRGVSVYICCTCMEKTLRSDRVALKEVVDPTTSRHVAGSRSTNTRTSYAQERHLEVSFTWAPANHAFDCSPISQHNSLIFGVNVGIARADNAPVACEEQWHFVATKPHRSMSEMWCRERKKPTSALNDTNSHQ